MALRRRRPGDMLPVDTIAPGDSVEGSDVRQPYHEGDYLYVRLTEDSKRALAEAVAEESRYSRQGARARATNKALIHYAAHLRSLRAKVAVEAT